MKWEDTSSYRKSDDHSIPKEYTLRIPDGFKVIIHHMIYSPPEVWFMSCHSLNLTQRQLKSTSAADAQAEAIKLCKKEANNIVECLKRLEETK